MAMIGVGLLGTGFMGKAHTFAYTSIPVLMGDVHPRLVAICGRNPDKTRILAEQWGYEKWYTDWRKLIEDPDVEVVDNSLPNHLHRDPSIAAAEKGKAIICEKPLARSLAEAREMVRAVEKAGVVNGTIFNKRWLPSVRLAKKLIDEGVIGRVLNFRFVYFQDWGTGINRLLWRFKKELAGYGVLGDQGSHVIDMARFLLGDFKRVVGLSRRVLDKLPNENGVYEEVDVEDTVSFLAETESGAIGTIGASRFASGRRNYLVFEIYGEEGSLFFDMERLNELWVYTRSPPEVDGFKRVLVTDPRHPFFKYFWPAGHTIGWAESHTLQLYHFLKAVRTGEEYHPDFRDGAAVNAVMDAVYKSLETGGFVEVEKV